MTIADLGLKVCSDCKYRFDCILVPAPRGSSYNIDWWVLLLAMRARHPIKYFDALKIYGTQSKCIFEIKEKYVTSNWKEVDSDEVILSGTFLNELLLYAREAYPGFEQRKEQ